MPDTPLTDFQVQQMIASALDTREYANVLRPSPIAAHAHTGTDSGQIDQNDVLNGPKGLALQYFAQEYDNGSVTTTATINWANGNVQYVTLTGNTTLTFSNAQSGMRAILHVAGAFTPTFPSTVRWSSGVTPTPTASAGHKDVYSFIYSGKESLYDGVQSANFATT